MTNGTSFAYLSVSSEMGKPCWRNLAVFDRRFSPIALIIAFFAANIRVPFFQKHNTSALGFIMVTKRNKMI